VQGTDEMPTKAQVKELRRAASTVAGPRSPGGVVTCPSPTRGLAASGWERMMGRLCEAGFFRPYVHGGYEITDEGRRAAGDS